MQALLLAAGMGKRLKDLTKDNTKCMLEVNGKRLIDRLIEQLIDVGIKKFVIVIGYQGQKLIEHIGSRYTGKIDIQYIENEDYATTNNIYSLMLAEKVLLEDDTILFESDLIFEERILRMLLDNHYPDLALVAKYESWMDGTMVQIDKEMNILNFIPKKAFRYEDVSQYYKTVNIYKFSKQFSENQYVPFLDAYCKVMGNNEYYEQVLRVITMLQHNSLKALPIGDAKWYEIDDIQDLDIASTIFSDGVVKWKEYHKRYGGYWRFPNLLDYCYLVNPYFPGEDMKMEIKANFYELITSYPSGMYVNSLLAGKYFGVRQEYICVGNGAAELIKVAMEQFMGGKTGVVFPTFDEYPNRLNAENIVPFIPKNENFSYTADDMIDFYSNKDISLLLLINPDNPSGNFIPKQDVLRLADFLMKKGIRLLVDESFVDFVGDGTAYRKNSLLDNEILERYPNMLVMKSISKSYGVPGLRLGVLASCDLELIAKIKREVPIWNINSIAEFYMQIFGKYEGDYAAACVKFAKEREIFYKELQQIEYLRVIPSQANYFLCEVKDRFTAKELVQKLVDNNVIVSNCSLKRNIDGVQLVRIAIRDRRDNSRLIEILKLI
jgi:hypothetical protein